MQGVSLLVNNMAGKQTALGSVGDKKGSSFKSWEALSSGKVLDRRQLGSHYILKQRSDLTRVVF